MKHYRIAIVLIGTCTLTRIATLRPPVVSNIEHLAQRADRDPLTPLLQNDEPFSNDELLSAWKERQDLLQEFVTATRQQDRLNQTLRAQIARCDQDLQKTRRELLETQRQLATVKEYNALLMTQLDMIPPSLAEAEGDAVEVPSSYEDMMKVLNQAIERSEETGPVSAAQLTA